MAAMIPITQKFNLLQYYRWNEIDSSHFNFPASLYLDTNPYFLNKDVNFAGFPEEIQFFREP